MSASKIIEAAISFLPDPPADGMVHIRKGASGHYAVYKSSPGRSVRLGEKIYFGSEEALKRALIRAGYTILPEERNEAAASVSHQFIERARQWRVNHLEQVNAGMRTTPDGVPPSQEIAPYPEKWSPANWRWLMGVVDTGPVRWDGRSSEN